MASSKEAMKGSTSLVSSLRDEVCVGGGGGSGGVSGRGGRRSVRVSEGVLRGCVHSVFERVC